MISPQDIKAKALRWYNDVLRATIQGERYFPRSIPFGKVKAGETLAQFQSITNEIQALKEQSRQLKGHGYDIVFVTRRDRKIGLQEFPDQIVFNTINDYLQFIGKEKEYRGFVSDIDLIRTQIPRLLPWASQKPQLVVAHAGRWEDLLKVASFFLELPRPDLYIRELPIEVPTKFIESNEAIIRTLLDELIPQHQRDPGSKVLAERYYLKYNEPQIRLKLLDPQIATHHFSGLGDLSIPQSAFNTLDLPVNTVFILENKTNFSNIYNFLTLPALDHALAIFGSGFKLGVLKDAAWLHNCSIWYWGDIDPQGFRILHQMRTYFPHTKSFLMDRATFDGHLEYVVDATPDTIAHLPHLTKEEQELYAYLVGLDGMNRLEQERVGLDWVRSRWP